MPLLTIDGTSYDVAVKEIKRSANILDGENAGRLISGRMVRDIIGTYYNYSITLNAKALSRAQYDSMYEVLTAPVDSHTIVVPYGQGTLSFEAYVSNVNDVLRWVRGGNLWGDLTVNFVAMAPQRTPA
jgi:hypothetical protein